MLKYNIHKVVVKGGIITLSRLEDSAKNITSTVFTSFLTSLLGLVSRGVFTRVLTAEYLGISGLFGNIFGMLSLAELGIGTAIGFSLYKPLAEHDYNEVSALMTLYKRAYRLIGSFVAIGGIILFFFLDFFIEPEKQPDGLNFAYFVYLIDTVSTYFISYKMSLINSDAKGYKLFKFYFVGSITQIVLKIISLLVFRDYENVYSIYLIVQIVCTISLTLIENRYVTHQYDYIDFSSKIRIRKTVKNTIIRNITGLVASKIGDYLVNSTDNLIITKFIDLTTTGIYSNYITIRQLFNSYVGALFTGTSASFGNVVAKDDTEKRLKTFDIMFYAAFLVYSLEANVLLSLFNPAIELAFGSKYSFGEASGVGTFFTVFLFCLCNYLTGLRMPLIIMKSASGTYLEDAWLSFGFAAVNLVSSVILVKKIGIDGVIIGTILGGLCTSDWFRPFIIFKKIF